MREITREVIVAELDRGARNVKSDTDLARKVTNRLTCRWRAIGQSYPEHMREYDEVMRICREELAKRQVH